MKYHHLIYLTFISFLLQGQELEIRLRNGDHIEIEGKKQMEKILNKYENKINRWFFTREIEIDKNSIPFSHPVLTLNCNYLNDDLKQLSNFLHEQFHWFVSAMPQQEKSAIEDFRKIFPKVPLDAKKVARDEYSTYLHLIVCDLEFQSMTAVLGEDAARHILKEWNHYSWIYDKVLHDKRVREINKKHEFTIH
jgi:hypothetical protein